MQSDSESLELLKYIVGLRKFYYYFLGSFFINQFASIFGRRIRVETSQYELFYTVKLMENAY